jgi:hypothetical protein
LFYLTNNKGITIIPLTYTEDEWNEV